MSNDNYRVLANQNSVFADDSRQKWISTLAIGNGAALFAVFSLGFKDGAFLYPVPCLLAAWSFLLGVAAASVAHLSTSAEARYHEVYWRMKAAQQSFQEAGQPGAVIALQPEVDKNDRLGDRAGLNGGIAALVACIAFVAGVAVPLASLTLKQLAG